MDKSRLRFLFASSAHPFMQKLAGLQSLRRTTEYKGRTFMLDVLKAVPPVQSFVKFNKPPQIVYPEDKWRKKFTRDVLNSKYRYLINRPVVMYAGYFDSSKDIIEVAVRKQWDLLSRSDVSVSSETAYKNVKTWLFGKLEEMSHTDPTVSVFAEKLVKSAPKMQASEAYYNEVAQFYENLLAEEDKVIDEKRIPLPMDNITPTSLEIEKDVEARVLRQEAKEQNDYTKKAHLQYNASKDEMKIASKQ